MRTVNKHPDWYNVPLRLTIEQKESPDLAIGDFFECYHLDEVRHILWNWMVEVVSSPNGISHDHHERNNHLFFYEKMELLVEAAFTILRKKRRRERRNRNRAKKQS